MLAEKKISLSKQKGLTVVLVIVVLVIVWILLNSFVFKGKVNPAGIFGGEPEPVRAIKQIDTEFLESEKFIQLRESEATSIIIEPVGRPQPFSPPPTSTTPIILEP
ncbi:hypothetical protein CL634_07085 [bacterium]|nr:hypothetical protein [bacterium]|tara:strand:+ start:923 stop:1240 length:318 start_codon:yes stop_codon:yes gene_type:complete